MNATDIQQTSVLEIVKTISDINDLSQQNISKVYEATEGSTNLVTNIEDIKKKIDTYEE
jgi:methyl-accepting chemotaxis protein